MTLSFYFNRFHTLGRGIWHKIMDIIYSICKSCNIYFVWEVYIYVILYRRWRCTSYINRFMCGFSRKLYWPFSSDRKCLTRKATTEHLDPFLYIRLYCSTRRTACLHVKTPPSGIYQFSRDVGLKPVRKKNDSHK